MSDFSSASARWATTGKRAGSPAPARIALISICLLTLAAIALVPVASSQVRGGPPARTGYAEPPRFHDPRHGDPLSSRFQLAGPKGLRQSLLSEPRHPQHQLAPTDTITNNWTNLFPHLSEVSAVSATDAWAVGEYGTVLHFTGGSWTAVDPPVMRSLQLWDVSMVSANSGWIIGDTGAFRYDGANWTDASNGLGSSVFLSRISALSATNAWAVGTICDFTTCGNTFLHSDGSTWAASGPTLPSSIYVSDINMSGPTVGWAVGAEYLSNTSRVGYVARYDGTSWTRVPAPPSARTLYGISSGGVADAWAAGYDNNFQGQIYHYNGSTWTVYTYPTSGFAIPFEIYMLNASSGWAITGDSVLHWDGTSWAEEYSGSSLMGLSGSGGQAWAVGWASTILSRAAGPTWTLQHGGPTTNWLYSVSAVSPSEAWAVGDYGTVVHYYSNTWQLAPTGFTNALFRVQMLSATEGYSVGANVIARWNGASWTTVASPPMGLAGLSMLGPGDGWAVGEFGSIWRDAGGSWAAVSSPVTGTLYTVAMDSPTHGWAGGGYVEFNGSTEIYHPALLEYSGGSWIDRSSTLPHGSPIIADIVLSSNGADGWAVGDADFNNPYPSSIMRLQNGVWSLDTASQTFASLASVAPEAAGESWTLGCGDYRHYVGATWQYEELPTTWCGFSAYNSFGFTMLHLSLVPGRGGWAVGPSGQIFHYNPLADGRRFYDVPLNNPFYTYIEYMATHNIVSGYADNSFRPNATTTRGQLCKIVVLAENWVFYTPPTPTFSDVPVTDPFYQYIETAYSHGIISGYTCGTGCLEFRPTNNITRGQLSKVIVLAQGWTIYTPLTPTFRDVSTDNAFYTFVETSYNHGIISGYTCGASCLEFRPGNNATRGQICKIVYNAVTTP